MISNELVVFCPEESCVLFIFIFFSGCSIFQLKGSILIGFKEFEKSEKKNIFLRKKKKKYIFMRLEQFG